jgi:hypothetical protein
MVGLRAVVDRERRAALLHRASLRPGGSVPPPAHEARGTFAHGFFLPFSLIVATVRDPSLRGPYVRLVLGRLAAVVVLASLAVGTGGQAHQHHRHHQAKKRGAAVVVRHDDAPARDVHVEVPGVLVDVHTKRGERSQIRVLGQDVPVVDVEEAAEPAEAAESARDAHDGRDEGDDSSERAEPPTKPGWLARLEEGWGLVLAVFASLSAATAVVVALSRRYDDHLGFHASRLANVAPEDPAAVTPKIAIDLRWLKKKVVRRVKSALVFAAGVPVFALLTLVPTFGETAFQAALVLWGWYWLGVFSAAKSAHAWADADAAHSPALIRSLEGVPQHRLTAPVRAYARLWAALTRWVNAPAAAFERSPTAFLGLALARAILAVPVVSLLARPLVPIAAGRLVAEADPTGRFFATAAPEPVQGSGTPMSLDVPDAA